MILHRPLIQVSERFIDFEVTKFRSIRNGKTHWYICHNVIQVLARHTQFFLHLLVFYICSFQFQIPLPKAAYFGAKLPPISVQSYH